MPILYKIFQKTSNSERLNASLKTGNTVKDVQYYHLYPVWYWSSQPVQYGKKKKFKASIWERKSKTVFIHRQYDPVHKKSFVESTESKQNQLDLARS